MGSTVGQSLGAAPSAMDPLNLNFLSGMTDTAMEDTPTTVLGGNGRAPPAPGSNILGAVVDVSSMAVSVILDRRLRLRGPIVEGAAPRD